MDSSKAAKAVRDAISGPLGEGLYTHAYAAYGLLDVPEPLFQELVSPDGRDVFDLASMTKALVTTPLIYAEIVAGRLSLDHTLGQWLGAQGSRLDPRLLALTVRSLLRHESGLPAWRNFWVNHLGVLPEGELHDRVQVERRMLEVFGRVASEIKTDGKSVYSDVGFLLLGFALEQARGKSLAAQFDELCQTSLHLENRAIALEYAAAQPLPDRAIPTAQCLLRGRLLRGEVHDENCASLGGITAHAGLFGPGRSVARFLHHLARSKPGRLLLEDNAKARKTPPNDPLIGWRQAADPSSETFGGGMAMGHMGFVGTAFWVCPDRGDYAIFLTNRVISGRMRPGIAAARREVFRSLSGFRT